VAIDVMDNPNPDGDAASGNVFMPETGTRTACNGDTCGNACE
jgi:hypothetical protein